MSTSLAYGREKVARYCPLLSWHSTVKVSVVLLAVILGLSLSRSQTTPPIVQPQHATRATIDECSNPPRDSCSFYDNCLETRYNCGLTGYPIGYGQHYCQKFSDRRSELSPKGQIWMLDTMHCLQTTLIPEATGAVNITCDALKDKAFGSHAKCYVHSGLCTLPPKDWLVIVNIVQLKTLFQSLEALKETVDAGTECLEFYGFVLTHALF